MTDHWNLLTITCPVEGSAEATSPLSAFAPRAEQPAVPIALEQRWPARASPPVAASSNPAPRTPAAAAPTLASAAPSSRPAPPFARNLKHENHLWLAPGSSLQFDKQVNDALRYVQRSRVAAKLIADLAHGPADVFIQERHEPLPPAYFDPNTRTVHFNPCVGALWSNGSMAKPAMILLHELGHAWGFVYKPEERQRDMEAPVSKELGEPMRDGGSKPVPATCLRDTK